jgi:protocatechuate 3,4-dioxygenase beta subunit
MDLLMRFGQVSFLITILLMLVAPSRGDEPAGPRGAIVMRVVGPDGQVVARHRVIVVPCASSPEVNSPDAQLTLQSDAQGEVRFDWAIGNTQFNIEVPGHGYGATGIVAVRSGKPAVALLPRLAPYAVVSGQVTGGKPAYVMFGSVYEPEPVTITADKAGHFRQEVHAGFCAVWASLTTGSGDDIGPQQNLVLQPGQEVTGLSLTTTNVPQDLSDWSPSPATQPAKGQVTLAEGTIRDDAEQPVRGAEVAIYLRRLPDSKSDPPRFATLTDADGHYAIKAPAWWAGDEATLVVRANGTPAEMTRLDVSASAKSKAPPIDLALSSHGGTLDVTVLLDGKPDANVPVTLYREDAPGEAQRAEDWPGESDYLEGSHPLGAILSPSISTDPHGVAHFTALRPGRYSVDAVPDDIGVDAGPGKSVYGAESGWSGRARSVAVCAGQTAHQQIALYEHLRTAVFDCVGEDGKPADGPAFLQTIEKPIDRDIGGLSIFGGPSIANGLEANMQFADGLGRFDFDSPGLKSVTIAMVPQDGWIWREPYMGARVVAAVSSRIESGGSARARLRQFEPGSVSVLLLDAAGKPAHGVVEIGLPQAQPIMIGSTGDDGRIVFQQLPSSSDYLLHAWVAGMPTAQIDMMSDTLPADAELTHKYFVPAEAMNVQANQHLSAELRAIPAAFVRGTAKSPFTVSCVQDATWPSADQQANRATGEFVAGPFAAGTVVMYYGLSWPGLLNDDQLHQSIPVAAGKVTHFALPDVSAMVKADAVERARWTDRQLLTGRVFRADGKTPAYAAVVKYFVPHDVQPKIVAGTDAAGNLDIKDTPSGSITLRREPPGGPDRPVLVATLPGECGAAIVGAPDDLTKPVTLALPPPISWRGKLTVNGKSIAGQVGQFRVYAAYQDKGMLDELLSLWATPQDDGSFELAGLTPGTYKVQASLDGIWLSDTATLTASDKPQGAIHLDIPAPGGPAVIHCASAKGKPLCGVSLIVDRPVGPLTEMDWPAEFTSDGAGDVWIPALEEGKHAVRLKDDPKAAVDFTVPPLPAKDAVAVKLIGP